MTEENDSGWSRVPDEPGPHEVMFEGEVFDIEVSVTQDGLYVVKEADLDEIGVELVEHKYEIIGELQFLLVCVQWTIDGAESELQWRPKPV